jgi:hypothetical protein
MSIYPNAIDGYEQIPLVVDGVTPVNAFSVNNLREAILNIEIELGLQPSGTFSTVRARLDALDAGGSASIEDIENRLDAIEEAIVLIEIAIANLEDQQELPDLSNIQYSVLMEDPAGDLIFQKIRQFMIEDDFAITSLNLVGGSLIEVGDTLNSPSFTAGYTVTPVSASFIDDQGNPAADVISTPTSFTYPFSYLKNTYNATVVFDLTANDNFIADNASATKRWVQKVFWGVGPAGGSTEAFIESLSNNSLATSRNRTFTTTAGATDKIYYAYRSGYGDADFAVGGFSGGFFKVSDTILVTNSFGFAENYTLYESDNLALGTTTVVVT